jgi:hypothetical protein
MEVLTRLHDPSTPLRSPTVQEKQQKKHNSYVSVEQRRGSFNICTGVILFCTSAEQGTGRRATEVPADLDITECLTSVNEVS